MLISNAVHIWRESDGDYHIEWRASDPGTKVTVEPVIADIAVEAHYAADIQQDSDIRPCAGNPALFPSA